MPVPISSRLMNQATPSFVVPARPKHTRVMSPSISSTSYSPTVTSGGQQHKLNVVTRVAIEGTAKQGQDGASIKMYLKIALPLDSVAPGSTIPLFPEENVKILTSQVHPIDNNSVPYNFSSSVSPLLHNAARALNLPARSSETYASAINLPQPSSSSYLSSSKTSKSNGFSSTNSETVPPIDAQYTGQILVSGYHISYVVPKIFPVQNRTGEVPTDNEDEGFSRSSRSRRASLGEKNSVNFMAAIDIWVPYVSRPPRSPYLLSIPTPRCLHNNIKLRIFPPTVTSSSFASLSSLDDDGSSWDLTSDPHVTRSASTRPSRSNSYSHFADDESSDSSTAGFSDGCGIQGTFPSAERIRVRWAKPLRTIDVPGRGGDGRRRVGVKEVKGEMTCVVRGKMKNTENIEGVVMAVDYKGTCKNVWFPGVATLLGMDVGLEAKGSDVSWVEGSSNEWVVGGGVGYTGFDVGESPRPASRSTSLDSNSPQILISTSRPQGLSAHAGPSVISSRQNSTSSTSSLLRAPLPAQNVADYSFEGSTATLASSVSSPLGTVSSISSFPPSSTPNLEQSSTPESRPPGVPITLHLNMNELLPSAKNIFTFSISGTILVTPRPALAKAKTGSSKSSPVHSAGENEPDADTEPIVLPRFTVLAADSEATSIVVRNEVDGGATTVDVYNLTGDITQDAQARKTVLQKGGFTKCLVDGGRIVLRSIRHSNASGRPQPPSSRPRTPNTNTISRIPSNPSLARMIYPPRPKRNGPLIIPSVMAMVTTLVRDDETLPDGYAVRVCLNAPADTGSEWLEFGLAQPGPGASTSSLGAADSRPPRVDIASATVEGVPVRFETSCASKQEPSGLGLPFEEMSGKEWITWVRVHVGAMGGENVIVDYVVRRKKDASSRQNARKDKGKASDKMQLNVFLPTFSIPVGRLEVKIDTPSSGLVLSSLQSNFTHQQSTAAGRRLLHFSMEEFFYPYVSLTVHRLPVPATASYPGLRSVIVVTWAMILLGLVSVHRLRNEVRQMGRSLEGYSIVMGSGWNDVPEPVTITTTVYSSTGTRWWFSEVSTETESIAPFTASPVAIITSTQPLAQIPTATVSSLSSSVSEAKDISISPTNSISVLDEYALLPIQNILSISWPIQDFHIIRSALNSMMQTMEIVWQMFRKAYHYPLDPI